MIIVGEPRNCASAVYIGFVWVCVAGGGSWANKVSPICAPSRRRSWWRRQQIYGCGRWRGVLLVWALWWRWCRHHGDFVPRPRLRYGECCSVLAMEVLGVVQRPASVHRRLASLYVHEWLLDSGSMCSRQRLSGASGYAVLVWLLSGVLVLWSEGGDFPPSTIRMTTKGFAGSGGSDGGSASSSRVAVNAGSVTQGPRCNFLLFWVALYHCLILI